MGDKVSCMYWYVRNKSNSITGNKFIQQILHTQIRMVAFTALVTSLEEGVFTHQLVQSPACSAFKKKHYSNLLPIVICFVHRKGSIIKG